MGIWRTGERDRGMKRKMSQALGVATWRETEESPGYEWRSKGEDELNGEKIEESNGEAGLNGDLQRRRAWR